VPDFWAAVLAGGQGTRLRPLILRLYGEDRPKQYAPLIGSRSLLRATLDRVASKVPLSRTAVVTARSHQKYSDAEFGGASKPRLLAQPRDRGTAAGVLLPVHWVARQEPNAVIAVFPSDHFVTDNFVFMEHVERVVAFAQGHPDRIVLLGATPAGPDGGYGWIEPGDELGESGSEILRVRRFCEKPSPENARFSFDNGHLWNTFVMVGVTSAFIEAGRRILPALQEQLARAAPSLDTPAEQAALERAYAAAPTADFSRAILEASSSFLAVSRLPDVGWSDWGTPERVAGSLRAAGISPPWLSGVPLPA